MSDLAVAVLEARIQELEGHFKFLDELIETRIIENDQPNRVKWHGVWYDGPLADAYLSTLRAIQKLAQAAIGDTNDHAQ